MLAVWLENGVVSLREVARPERPPGYALIRTLIAGICNTDLELQRGYYGFSGTPGHEFAGEVVEADDASLVSKRVAGEINLACGQCSWCRRNLGRHCPNRTVLGIVKQPGAFEEFFVLPERNLHVIPDGIPTESAVFIEPLAAACEILDQVRLPPGDTVAVLGDGKLGLLVSQALNAYGAKVMQYGRHQEKLLIAERSGVETAAVGAKLPEAEFDFVVDATGTREGLASAVKMVKPRGTIVMKSTVHGEVAIDTAPVIVNEITLVEPIILTKDKQQKMASELANQPGIHVALVCIGRGCRGLESFAEALKAGTWPFMVYRFDRYARMTFLISMFLWAFISWKTTLPSRALRRYEMHLRWLQ